MVSQRAPQLYAQSLKKKPASEDKATTETKPDNAVSQNQIPTYLIWGLVPVAGILVGGAFWMGKRSERNANSSTDFIEPEDELNYLAVEEIPAIEADPKQHNNSNSSHYPQIGATSRDDR